MQPVSLRQRLLTLYTELSDHFGHEPHWWPIFSDTPQCEMIIGTVLVQQTRWEAVEAAIVRLRDAGLLSPAALADADPSIVAELIKPCAFYNQKAPGIQAIFRHIMAHYAGDLASLFSKDRAALRAELLALPRIGRETADTIMLYAGGYPVFVVDAYARRLFARLDLASGFDFLRADYDAVQALVEGALTACDCALNAVDCHLAAMPCLRRPTGAAFPHLDGSLRHFLWDLHALIVEECIHHCLARQPRCNRPGAQRMFVDPRKCALHCIECRACPLCASCPTYQHAAGSQ